MLKISICAAHRSMRLSCIVYFVLILYNVAVLEICPSKTALSCIVFAEPQTQDFASEQVANSLEKARPMNATT